MNWQTEFDVLIVALLLILAGFIGVGVVALW